MKTRQFRINLKDYRKLRGLIPAKRGESAAQYFERVIEEIEEYSKYKMDEVL